MARDSRPAPKLNAQLYRFSRALDSHSASITPSREITMTIDYREARLFRYFEKISLRMNRSSLRKTILVSLIEAELLLD